MYAHWAIFKIITHILCLVNEQTTYASSVPDVLLSCAVGTSEYTGCLKSHFKLKTEQHKCRTLTLVRRPWKRCVLVQRVGSDIMSM